jgi:mannose-1-phosphate guanylyltransferase
VIPRVAMIFAAGYGRRLAPFTDHLPKPLAPLLNRPLLFHTLDTLSRLGVRRFVINAHHLADRLSAALGMEDGKGSVRETPWGEVELIHEASILGTGGGLMHARDRLQGEGDILVVNGDIAFDLDLQALIRAHERHSHLATLAVIRRADRPQLHKVVFASDSGVVRSFDGDATRRAPEGLDQGVFTGIHLIKEQLFERLDIEKGQHGCIVHHGYRGLLDEGLVGATPLSGHWDDLGTTPDLLRANHLALQGASRASFPETMPVEQFRPGVWVSPGARVDASVRLMAPVLIGQGAVIGEGATIGPSAIIGERAQIGAGSTLRAVVVLHETTVTGAHEQALLFDKPGMTSVSQR